MIDGSEPGWYYYLIHTLVLLSNGAFGLTYDEG
jgi:hypothetical protein